MTTLRVEWSRDAARGSNGAPGARTSLGAASMTSRIRPMVPVPQGGSMALRPRTAALPAFIEPRRFPDAPTRAHQGNDVLPRGEGRS